jgi:hypothetical protein
MVSRKSDFWAFRIWRTIRRRILECRRETESGLRPVDLALSLFFRRPAPIRARRLLKPMRVAVFEPEFLGLGIGGQALDDLDDLELALLNAEKLFGGHNGVQGWSKFKAALDRRSLNGMAPWRLHDLRRTVATGMAELGVQPHIIEAVLNHVSGHKAGVAGVYNRAVYAPEKAAALELWGRHVMARGEPL